MAGHNIRMYLRTAKEFGFTTELSEVNNFFAIKLLRENIYFKGTTSPYNAVSNTLVVTQKYCMNRILAGYGFPVPNAVFVDPSVENAWDVLEHINYPVVAKPAQFSSAGSQVLCYINDEETLRKHVEECHKEYQSGATIEEFHGGLRSFRVLVFRHRVIGVVERFPAAVIGDGVSTIQELIDIENERRREYTDLSQGSIKIDQETDFKLKTLGLTLNSIPKKDEKVEVCFSCNSTRGGSMMGLGKKIHKDNARLLCKASRILGLKMVGFDVNCEDIMVPMTHENSIIIEGNHNPDISIHENPMSGKPVRVSKYIIRRIALTHPISFIIGYHRLKRKTAWMLGLKAGLVIGALLTVNHYLHILR